MLHVFAFLENVASSPPDVLARYSQWMQVPPILMDAAACGWVSRRRAFWVSSRESQPPEDWSWEPGEPGVCGRLQYRSSKPVPQRIFFEQGFRPLWSPSDVMQGSANAFFVFSREFFHPCDNMKGQRQLPLTASELTPGVSPLRPMRRVAWFGARMSGESPRLGSDR